MVVIVLTVVLVVVITAITNIVGMYKCTYIYEIFDIKFHRGF